MNNLVVELIESCKCPISKQIFYEPVFAMDGITYEKTEIENWLKTNKTSPITRSKINSTLTTNIYIKNLIISLIQEKHIQKDDIYQIVYSVKNFADCGFNIQIIDKIPHISFTDLNEVELSKFFELENKYIQKIFKQCESLDVNSLLLFLKYVDNTSKLPVLQSIFENNKIIEKKTNNFNALLIEQVLTYCDIDVVKYLLSDRFNFDLELLCANMCKPIHVAIQHSTLEIVSLLLEKNIDVNVPNCDDITPIHMALEYSTIEVIELLLKHNVNLESSDVYGATPIMYALFCCKPEIVNLLLDTGVNINAVTKKNNTVINVACKHSTPEIQTRLINMGIDLNCVNDDGEYVVDLIVQFSTVDVLNLAISKNANLNSTRKSGLNSLELSFKLLKIDMYNVLKNYQSFNITDKDKINYLLENIKSIKNNDENIIALLENNKDLINKQFNNKNSLLIQSIISSRVVLINYLLDNNVDIEQESPCGKKPIYYCLKFCTSNVCFEIMSKLVKMNVDLTFVSGTDRDLMYYLLIHQSENYNLIKLFVDNNVSFTNVSKRLKRTMC